MKKLFAAAMALAGAIAVFAQNSKVINAVMPSAVLGQDKTYTVYLPEVLRFSSSAFTR